jgi:hypothetical protein
MSNWCMSFNIHPSTSYTFPSYALYVQYTVAFPLFQILFPPSIQRHIMPQTLAIYHRDCQSNAHPLGTGLIHGAFGAVPRTHPAL